MDTDLMEYLRKFPEDRAKIIPLTFRARYKLRKWWHKLRKHVPLLRIKVTLAFEDEDRRLKWWLSRKMQGFDIRTTWNLYMSIAEYIVPRLKLFRNNLSGYPSNLKSVKEWEAVLDDMIYAWEFVLQDDDIRLYEYEREGKHKEEVERYLKGMKLFMRYFYNLWD